MKKCVYLRREDENKETIYDAKSDKNRSDSRVVISCSETLVTAQVAMMSHIDV